MLTSLGYIRPAYLPSLQLEYNFAASSRNLPKQRGSGLPLGGEPLGPGLRLLRCP